MLTIWIKIYIKSKINPQNHISTYNLKLIFSKKLRFSKYDVNSFNADKICYYLRIKSNPTLNGKKTICLVETYQFF